MRRTYAYDPDLDAMVQIRGPGSNYYEPRSGLQIIRDIEPYRAIASDIASDNKRPVIHSRREHREFLRRNNYIETGNEAPIRPLHEPSARERQQDRVNDIKRAMGKL